MATKDHVLMFMCGFPSPGVILIVVMRHITLDRNKYEVIEGLGLKCTARHCQYSHNMITIMFYTDAYQVLAFSQSGTVSYPCSCSFLVFLLPPCRRKAVPLHLGGLHLALCPL